MISRVAEHCFWMARYLERAENMARVLEVNQTLLLDFDVPFEKQWRPLLIISGLHDFKRDAEAEAVQQFLTWEKENPCSIFSSMSFARENARIIRELISGEMWERINFYYLWMRGDVARGLYERNRNEFYNQIKRINQLLFGIGEGTISHGEAWDFFLLGKYLERASQTARIVDVKYHMVLPTPDAVGTPIDNAHWMAILKSCSGYESYHKERYGLDKGTEVADYLILDAGFPRSIRFCLLACREAAHKISRRAPGDPGNEMEQLLDDLIHWLDRRDIDELIRQGLHEALTKVVDHINDIGGAIYRVYFDFPEERLSRMLAAVDSQVQMQSTA